MKRLAIVLGTMMIASTIIAGCASPTQSPAPTTSAAPTSTAPKPTATPIPTASGAPQRGGTMTLIENTAPAGPIGAEWEGNANTYVTQQFVLERLLIEQLDGSMGPGMAVKWDVVNDPANPSITFTLRKGVKFHDGTDMNAAAIKWNMDMFANPGKLVPGAAPMFTSTTGYWKSYDILDDYTIRVNYTEWRNTFLRSWENYFMVSPGAFAQNGIVWQRDHMVGTGPFKQTDYQRDTSMTAIKYDGYYEAGKPYLDGLKINYIADELTRTASFLAGEAQVLYSGPKLASQQFQNKPGLTVISRKGGPWILSPDSLNADSPWAKLPVRQALEYALDKEALAKVFGYGYSGPAYQMSTEATKAYDPTIVPRKFDTAKAKQLLADAGYPNGFKTRIISNPVNLDRDAVVAIQAQLLKVGIDATLSFPQPAEWQVTYTSVVSPSNALLFTTVNEWSNYNTTLNVMFADPGTFYLKSMKKGDGWAALYKESLTTAAPDATVLKKVSNMFYNDATFAPVYNQSFVYVISSKLHDHGLLTRGTQNSWTIADTWLSK